MASTPDLLIVKETISEPDRDDSLLRQTCLTNCPFDLIVITEIIKQMFLVELVQIQNKLLKMELLPFLQLCSQYSVYIKPSIKDLNIKYIVFQHPWYYFHLQVYLFSNTE